jgi:hypothetical protein
MDCSRRHRQWSRRWTTIDGGMETMRRLAFVFGPLKVSPRVRLFQRSLDADFAAVEIDVATPASCSDLPRGAYRSLR